ncbi:MAG TPA: hypothetical protein VN875_19615 [Candidatus Binatus sp.]|nr:hypothetical protein [Candidatus Binatus sp.]
MPAHAQSGSQPEPAAPANDSSAIPIDGIAARIEDDIILESEVHELGAFQILSDGKAKPRDELIRELADQWIVRGEANTAKYPFPSADEIENAYQQFVKQFPSSEEFQKRLAAVDLTEAAVKRILTQQLYLAHFLDYRFRAAAQVDDKEVEKYYNEEFAPQLKARNEPVPPLEDVEETIREVIVQRAISDRAEKWLDDTRQRLKIDIVNARSPS